MTENSRNFLAMDRPLLTAAVAVVATFVPVPSAAHGRELAAGVGRHVLAGAGDDDLILSR